MAHFFKLAQDSSYYQGDALFSTKDIVAIKKTQNTKMSVVYADGGSVGITTTSSVGAPDAATYLAFNDAFVKPAIKSSQEHWAKGPVVREISMPSGYTFNGLSS